MIKHIFTYILKFFISHRYVFFIISLYSVIATLLFSKSFLEDNFAGDFRAYWIPNYYFFLQSLKEGVVPLWNPYTYMGLPMLFKSDLFIFYPGIWLYLLFNIIFNNSLSIDVLGKSLEAYQYSHLVLGATGTHILIRKGIKLSFITSVFAGFIYAFSIFSLSSLGDVMSLPSKMYLPWIIYCILQISNTKLIKYQWFLVVLNYIIFSLGYPYYFVYFALVQCFLAIILGKKTLINVIKSLSISFGIACFFLLPNLHIFSNSFRGGATAISDTFHLSGAFIPTRIVNILNPIVFKDFYDLKDPFLLFGGSIINWGLFPLILIILGFGVIKMSKFNTFSVLLFILSFIYILSGYLNLPDIIRPIFPIIDKFRSHSQALVFVNLSAVIVISYGFENLLLRRRSRVMMFFLWQLSLYLSLLVFILPFVCQNCTSDNNDVAVSMSRVVLVFVLLLILIEFYLRFNKKIFIIIAMCLTLLEYSNYFKMIDYLHSDIKQSAYFTENSLIGEKPSKDNLFRYFFEGNQFSYNTSPLKIFSYGGYESMTYESYYYTNRLGENAFKFSNIKYIVTTNKMNLLDNSIYELIEEIDPKQVDNELFISSVPGLPYWSPDSLNHHYVYKVKDYFPRFFVSKKVVSCVKYTECLGGNPHEVIYTLSDVDFLNPEANKVKIDVLDYNLNTIVLQISTPQETFVSSSEVYDSGWKAKVNGKNTTVYNIEGGFRGFIVPKGDSKVYMYYVVPNLKLGLFLTLFTWSIILYVIKYKYTYAK